MTGRIKKAILNNRCCFASALLAGAFFLFACYYFKAYPFDKNYCLIYSDLSQQYYPMLTHLYDIIRSGRDVLYSWSSGLGYPFFGNIGNVISPFNVIMFLFSREDIALSVTYIVLAKLMFTSYCFSYYLRKAYDYRGVFNVIPSLLYALSGFFIAYYIHIMWLDLLYCLPLVILGLHRLVDEKKPRLYLLTLAYVMILGAYGAYMFCIFLCLYFVYYYLKNNSVKNDFSKGLFKSNFFKNGLYFAGFSVLAAMLAAVMLIPTLFAYTATSASTESFESGVTLYYNPLLFIAQQFSGSTVTFQNAGAPKLPNCWAGLFTVILIPAYLLSKQFSKKERTLDFLFLCFMYLSLSLNVLSFVWCGFHFANGFADRFAYFYIFLAVTVMAKALNNIDKIKKPVIVCCAVCAAVFIAAMRLLEPDDVEKYTVIISLSFIAIWLAVYFISFIKKADKALLKVVVLFLLCFELVFAQLENLSFDADRRDFNRYSDVFTAAYSQLKESDSDLFYRVEAYEPQNRSYPYLLDYYGISGFSSIIPQAVLESQHALGISGNTYNRLMYLPETPVYNSIFGIKYLIGPADRFPYSEMFTRTSDDLYAAFEYGYYLPLGFCVDEAAAEFNSEIDSNPFYTQNEMFTSMSGAPCVFYSYAPDSVSAENAVFEVTKDDAATETKIYEVKQADADENGHMIFDYSVPENGDYYIYISHVSGQNSTEITLRGEQLEYARNISDFCIEPNAVMPLGECSAGDRLTVNFVINKAAQEHPIAVYLARFDKDAFEEGYKRLSKNTLTLTEFENTRFCGNVNADKNCLLFTSVPYDRGWTVSVDGEKLNEENLVKIDGAYIAVPLSQGSHTVEFRFCPYGLKTGAVISSVTAVGLTAFIFIRRKKKKA